MLGFFTKFERSICEIKITYTGVTPIGKGGVELVEIFVQCCVLPKVSKEIAVTCQQIKKSPMKSMRGDLCHYD